MTSRLDDRIRAFVLELVDDPPPAPEIDLSPADLDQTPSPAPARGPSVRRGLAALVAAAVVVLVAVGVVALWTFTGSDKPVVTTVPPTTTTAPPPQTTIAPSPLGLPDAWRRVGASVMTPVVGIFDMVETSSGLVAVGFDPGEEDMRQNGVILHSADGVTWARLAEDDPALNLGAILMYGVAEGGPGIVAVGMGCEDDAEPCLAYPTVWTSADGASWDRSAADPDVFGERGALLDVVNTEHGLVAAGGFYAASGETELIQPTVWLSPDGIEWVRVWQGEAYDYSAATLITGFQALTTSADGQVVGVGTAANDQGDFVGAVWTSVDGRTWDRVDPNSEVFASSNDSDVAVQDVAWGPGGFVAVGSDGGTEVAIWHSPDGLNWTRADTADQPFEHIGTLSAVDALDTGWIAAGPHGFSDPTGGTVTLWTSPDGLNWDRVHSIDPGYAMSIVATDSGIAVAGAMAGVDNFYAAVWAGPTFDPLAPPPDPGPTPPPAEDDAARIAEEGLACEELADLGYGYGQVVSYWVWYERPSQLDADATGVPCADLFPEETVEAVFGGSDSLPVEIIGDFENAIFTATGPAVDEGLICAAGTLEGTGGMETNDPTAVFRWEDNYTCDDGSGSFTLGADGFFADSQHETGVWDIAPGTGNYATLMGGGGMTTFYAESTDIGIGWVWLAAEDN